jgi:hypothetical protein
MFVPDLHTLPMLRTVKAEWLVMATLLILGALLVGYFACGERTLMVIDEHLGRQFDGARSAIDAMRDAFRANSGCTADCRRMLLQAVKRLMFRF